MGWGRDQNPCESWEYSESDSHVLPTLKVYIATYSITVCQFLASYYWLELPVLIYQPEI